MAGGPSAGPWERRACGVGGRIFRGTVRCTCGCSRGRSRRWQSPGRHHGDDPRPRAQPGQCGRGCMVFWPGRCASTVVGVCEGPRIDGAGGCGRLGARTHPTLAGQRSPPARARRASERVLREMTRGQSLVELAVSVPVVLLLTLGAVATVQIVDARAGLQAATQAAAAEAARAPDQASAQAAAQARFASMVTAYPLGSTNLRVTFGLFSRMDQVFAVSSGELDVSWAALVWPGKLVLQARAVVPIEMWRSRGTPP